MVSRLAITDVDATQLHIDDLPGAARRAFLQCITIPFFADARWYLAGGTALALYVGHRQSVDLDFFTPERRIDELAIDQELTAATSQWRSSYRERGTIFGELAGAKISLVAYPFFQPSSERVRCGTVHLLTPKDIAVMKIIAISQRGRKRDFVDLYWYCMNREPLVDIIKRAMRQYPGQERNINHIFKSLTYFADAEDEPMPELFFRTSWKDIRAYFLEKVPRAAREFFAS
ncbi:MAG: nucleotidyl transferase AbiEii/AbiGii toxin family protein [bacterium]|nr:nucleotidyl transferase AbiEii/AbiGii toxin family protein [bacterium]MDZ4295796.1 nucleotidyl transferase AbiEii/AbiGii toxin family protein [Patescibacteria group bacterium]